jgi:hypothetical protein
MRVSWVIADDAVLAPNTDPAQLKTVGSLWGGWRNHRAYQIDNVVCNDLRRTTALLQHQIHQQCNLFVSKRNYQTLGRPEGLQVYEGEFMHELDRQDEIVTLHLAAGQSDIMLLLGFDWQPQLTNPDALLELRAHNYRQLVRQVIADNEQIQWVLIDHPPVLMPELANLSNLTVDTIKNVFDLLAS